VDETVSVLPGDVEELRAIIVSMQAVFDSIRRQYEVGVQELRKVQAENEDLRRQLYGRKSERVEEPVRGQGNLFNEAEKDSSAIPEPPTPTILVRRSIGKKRGRKHPGAHLERVEKVHDLSENEKCCPCCGKERPRIGEEKSEEIEIIPAHAVVTVHLRPKYGPCHCEGFSECGGKPIITAPAPAKIVPGSSFSNGSIASFLVAKYVDALPFYRQERIVSRYGLEVGRGTMAHLAIAAARRLGPLIELMQRDIRASPVVGMDETVVQVLKEIDRKPSSESRMWVARGYQEGKPILFFSYSPSRAGAVAASILGDTFEGYLQTDGYSGYTAIGERPGILHVGCWAHIRREFHKIYRSQEKSPLAFEMINLIRKLYSIESHLRDLFKKDQITAEEFCARRQADTDPVFKTIHEWLYATIDRVPPRSSLGEAIKYALGQYERAIRYVGHPLLTPDNNALENSIRPFVIGRKNWLFYDTPDGAWAGATLYSIIESAKANGHEPSRYLRYLFDNLPCAKTDDDLERLLPYHLQPQQY
jgi:transposase